MKKIKGGGGRKYSKYKIQQYSALRVKQFCPMNISAEKSGSKVGWIQFFYIEKDDNVIRYIFLMTFQSRFCCEAWKRDNG